MPMDLQSTRLNAGAERNGTRYRQTEAKAKKERKESERASWKHLCNIIFNQIMKTFYLLLFYFIFCCCCFCCCWSCFCSHRCRFYLCWLCAPGEMKACVCCISIFLVWFNPCQWQICTKTSLKKTMEDICRWSSKSLGRKWHSIHWMGQFGSFGQRWLGDVTQ